MAVLLHGLAHAGGAALAAGVKARRVHFHAEFQAVPAMPADAGKATEPVKPIGAGVKSMPFTVGATPSMRAFWALKPASVSMMVEGAQKAHSPRKPP